MHAYNYVKYLQRCILAIPVIIMAWPVRCYKNKEFIAKNKQR